ncbi:MAG: phosphatidate cytidylyltransferase [Thiohalocapsa sp.]
MPIAHPLQQRLATAGVLTPVVILAVLFLPTAYFSILMGAVVCLGAFEWSGLIGLQLDASRWAYTALVAIGLGLLWFAAVPVWDLYVLAVAGAWWVATALALTRIRDVVPKSGFDAWLIPVGLVVLVPPWVAIVRLHRLDHDGPWLVLALMMLIWIADSVAYFSGRRWGRRKLAPVISPGKTRAGVYGALIGAALWGSILVLLLKLSPVSGAFLVLLCVLAALLSVVGDLFESLLKRRRGLKDAGSILPGHGGVLDRIDSMTAAAPLFALGLIWLEKSL